jgi:MFS family permease
MSAPRDALIADSVPADLHGASFGLRQSLDTIGAFLGPVIAIVLMILTSDNFTVVFWIAAIPAFLSFALIVFAVREPERPAGAKAVRSPLSTRQIGRLGKPFWVVVVLASAFTLARFSEAFLLLRAQSVGLPLALVPVMLVVMNIVYALSAWPAGALSDRIGRYGILATGFALLIAADLVLALASDAMMVAVGTALWGLHMGLTQGILSSLVADTAPVDLRGTAFGLFNLITGLATLAASVIAGLLWDWIGPAATFLAGAVFTVLALTLVPAAYRMIDVRSDKSSTS